MADAREESRERVTFDAMRVALKQAEFRAREAEAKLAQLKSESQAKRLQARVRELWPRLEDELRYFLEWYIEEHDGTPRVDLDEIVQKYVEATGKGDG